MLVYAGNWDLAANKRLHRFQLQKDVCPTLKESITSASSNDAVLIIEGEMVESAKPAAVQLSMFSSEEPRVSLSQSQASEAEWMTRVVSLPTRSPESLLAIAPNGLSGKTSPAFYPATADGTLPDSFEGWGNSGISAPGGCLTLSTSEFPNDAAVCSLSEILAAGSVLPQHFLSAKACSGILRRAEKRGKSLPPSLHAALAAVASAPTAMGE